MDLSFENMHDIFKDDIWKELGPVDPNWFEILTAQTPVGEGKVSDQDDLCANQEGNFKTPFDKVAVDSQLFSTPKVFRRSQIVSPETEDEQSFTAPHEKGTLPWMVTQSPALFQDAKVGVPGVKCGGVQSENDNSFDLLDTPKKSPVSYAKHISESLGAQINPDISWTSSLNTPPALPSTLILSKVEESPCPASVTADRNFIFVRKLFPSLSKGSTIGEARNKEMPAFSQGAVNCEAHESQQISPSLNQSERIWQQKVPDASEYGGLQSTEAGVLDGAGNVPSMFFANSSSALRKVKPVRIKRRQIIQTEENGCSSKDVSTTHNIASSEGVTPDVEPSRFPSSPPVKTGDNAISQWSPLNLSEIPPCTMENNILTEKLQGDTDSHQLARPSVKIAESGFIRKKRKFVYTVGTLKPQVQGEETHSQKMDTSSKTAESGQDVTVEQLEKAPNEADRCSNGKCAVKKQLKFHTENLQSAEAKVQDLDMSQLCRDFAHDFSQMSDSADQIKVAEDIQHDFSPIACLSAMKQAKQKARQADLLQNCDGTSNGNTSTSNQNTSICERTISDSGFQSTVSNTTHMTTSSYGLPCSINTGQSREWSGFKADVHMTLPSSTKKENEKVHLDPGAEPTLMSVQRLNKKQIQDFGEKSESRTEGKSTQQTSSTEVAVDNMYCVPLDGRIYPSLSEKTAASLPTGPASGFKTASNKGIHISSANLERAKRLFDETEGEKIFCDQSTKCDPATKPKNCKSDGSDKSTTSDTGQVPSLGKTFTPQLTASQRVDVTELCSLLEEADSQFEFTQFKTAKLKENCRVRTNSPQKADKEVDPDFLAGIDFDDSFNSDAEDHLMVNVMPDKITLALNANGNIGISNAVGQSTVMSLSSVLMKKNSSLPPDSEHIAEEEKCPYDLHRAEHSVAIKPEKSSTLMLDVAFKTAGENILRVSKKCLNKARSLFADLEEKPTEKSPNKQNGEIDTEIEKKGNMDSNTSKKNVELTPEDDRHVGAEIQNQEESFCSSKKVTSFGDYDIKRFRDGKTDTTICQSGFNMASGKQISISAKKMQQADAFFKDCNVMECTDVISQKKSVKHVAENVEYKKSISKFKNIQSNISKEQVKRFKNANAELVAHHTMEKRVDKVDISTNRALALKNAASFHRNPFSSQWHTSKNIDSSVVDEWSTGDGFCTASGKKVSVSADAMKKAECLLDEIHTPVDINREPNLKENTLRTGQLTAQVLPPKNSGFQTAGGKEVAISEAALKKAKTLFRECEELEDKISVLPPHSKAQVTGSPVINSGFFAASGKPVVLSSDALQKAKALFSDMTMSTDIPAVLDTTKSVKKHGEAQYNMDCGFKTARGAAVHVSQNILLKAKNILKESDDLVLTKEMLEAGAFSEGCDEDSVDAMLIGHNKTKVTLNDGDSEKKHLAQLDPNQKMTVIISEKHGCTKEDTNKLEKQEENTLPSQNCGFQTASGKAVALSSEALKKAKALLNDCQGVEDKMDAAPLQAKVTALPFRDGGFHSANGKHVALSSEALQKTISLFSDIGFSAEIPDVSQTRKSDRSGDDPEKRHFGFSTAGGAKVHVSRKSLLKTKHLFQDFDVSASAHTVQEAGASEEPGNGSTVNTIGLAKQKENTLPQQNGGFHTASGKAVAVSSEALKRANTMLSEYEGAENEIGISLPQVKNTVADPFVKSCGFLAASGKPVEFSSEALQKAKALFSDVSLHTDKSAVSDARRRDKKHEDAQNHTEKIHCGFTTAGGGKVHVSEESLLKASNLLKEFADGEDHYADSNSTSPHDLHKLDQSKIKDVKRTSNSGVSTARNEELPAKRAASSEVKPQEMNNTNKTVESVGAHGSSLIRDKTLTDVFKCQENKIVPLGVAHPHASPGLVKSCVLDCDITKRSEVESSDLNLQSLNLTGCTETQQRFLAQEALDCTKALLEDESLAGQSLSMTSEKKPLQDNPKFSNRSSEEEKVTGKRILGDADLTGQPPLKRRLLEELDRTVDGPKLSARYPVKCCPNGLIKDRGVFRYSASLQPNITKPCRDGKGYVDMKFQKTTPTESSAAVGRGSAHSKMPEFVPPFIKTAKPVNQKIPVLRENTNTPVFIPPFKKQRTILQESSSQQQEEEDKCQQILHSNNNTHVPASKNLQGTTDDAANHSTMNNQSVLVDSHSVSSGAETSHVDEAVFQSRDMHQNLQDIELARDMQDMRIRKKKRQTIRPLPGSLFLTKTSGVMRIPLKVAVDGKHPARCTSEQLYEYGVHRQVSEVCSETSESFRFNLLQFIRQETLIDGGGVQLADGGWLIPSNDWTAGKEEFYRALCDTPGVDPKLISEAWVYNHYRWIVWKQASMEKSFPETMGSFCLTPEQVLLQLKYRYDVEVDHSCRPALRKIMEKDDTAAKTMVLCVGEIVSRGQSPNKQNCNNNRTPQTADAKVETQSAVVWLTDGWYAIKAQLDEPLTAMLHKGLLAVGGKLIVNGAQLVGSQDACSPLEAPESLMLKICANSCRRARWNAKLGFHRDPRPFLLPLSSLYSNGGPVGCVDIVILRSYPLQWMERKPDGIVIFRSTRAEEKEARQYDNHKHKAMEMLFGKIQAEFEKEEKGNLKPQRRKQVSHQNIRSLQDGEELYEAIGEDPGFLEAHLSEQQLETFQSYRRSLMEKKNAELQDRYRRAVEAECNEMSCPKRDVATVWRISIADSLTQPNCVYQLNLWRPSSDLQSLLKEGSRYKVYNLITSDGKKRSSIDTIQLTGTKKTQFQDIQASQEWLSVRFQPRVSINFENLHNTEFQPLCGEVDLAGYVISVVDAQGSSPAFYLADEKLNFVKVRCFSSLSQAGLEDLVKPCVLLALSNLQLRGQSLHPTPVVYAGDLTAFSTNPKEVHLQESLSHLKNLVQGQENFLLNAEEKLSDLVKSNGLSSMSSLALQPQTPASTTDRRQDSKTSKPIRNLGSFTPVNKNPPAGTSSTEKDLKNSKKRRALDYLSRIPSPPPLSLLSSLASPCISRTFNPPRRSGTPSTLKKSLTPIKKPTDSLAEDEWVNDEELAMIDTQALHGGDLK